MLISELQDQLEATKEKYGDREIFVGDFDNRLYEIAGIDECTHTCKEHTVCLMHIKPEAQN